MKTFALIFVMFSLFVVKSNAQDSEGTNKQEKKVLRLVNNLPEVKALNDYRRKKDPNRLVKAYIEFTPTLHQNYYSVSVCDDFADRLFAYYRFKVYLPNYTIYYDDVERGKMLPLKVWQKHPYGIYGKPK